MNNGHSQMSVQVLLFINLYPVNVLLTTSKNFIHADDIHLSNHDTGFYKYNKC